MILTKKEKYQGRCKRCSRAYECDFEDTFHIESPVWRYIICPTCGFSVPVYLEIDLLGE